MDKWIIAGIAGIAAAGAAYVLTAPQAPASQTSPQPSPTGEVVSTTANPQDITVFDNWLTAMQSKTSPAIWQSSPVQQEITTASGQLQQNPDNAQLLNSEVEVMDAIKSAQGVGGSVNPYYAYNGWQGAGYYIWPAYGNVIEYASTQSALQQYNYSITGNNTV